MRSRSDIWLGDALHVRRALSLDADAMLEMLRLLGLDRGGVAAPVRGDDVSVEAPQPGPSELAAERPPPKSRTGDAAEAPARESISTRVHSMLERMEPHASSHAPPAWFAAQRPVARAFAPRLRPPRPLFSALQRRSIVSYAIGRDVPEGDLDIEAIADILARGRMLTTLPRRPRRTLRYGVEVVVDRARWMEPFLADQDGLVDYLETLLPSDRLRVSQITGKPPERPRAGPQRIDPNRLHPHAAVLALTDLGVGYRPGVQAPPSARDWREYAHAQRRADRALVVLMPYERPRWPGSLSRSMAILHWSERTTAGHARHLRGGGRPDHAPRRREREEAHVRDLARVLSTCARVDPWLLREARLVLVPQADAGTEADLWFSGLVASRGPAGLVFKPPFAEALRSELAAMPEDSIAEALRLIERAHARYPEITRIEEQLGALSVAAAPAEGRVDALLRPALKALHEREEASGGAARSADIARWTLHAWDRLPAAVRQTDTARQLAVGAALKVRDSEWIRRADSSAALPEDAAWLLPESAAPDIGYGVELRRYPDGEMELVATLPYPLNTARHMIRVPGTEPALLEVRRTTGDGSEAQLLALAPGATLPLGAIDGAYDFVLRTLRGDRCRLATASARDVAERCLVWVTQEPDAVDEPGATGIYVGDRIAITAGVFEDRSVVYVHAQPSAPPLRAVAHRAPEPDGGWGWVRIVDSAIDERHEGSPLPLDVDATLAGLSAGRTGSQMEPEFSLFWRSARGLRVRHTEDATGEGPDSGFDARARGGLLFDGNVPHGPALVLPAEPPGGEGIQSERQQQSSDVRREARRIPLREARATAHEQLLKGWRLIVWSASHPDLEKSLTSLLVDRMGRDRVANANPQSWESGAIASPALGRWMGSRGQSVLTRVDAVLLIGDVESSAYPLELAHAESIPVLWAPVGNAERLPASVPEHLAAYLRSRKWFELPADPGDEALRELAARIAQWQPDGAEVPPPGGTPISEQAAAPAAVDRPTGSVRSRILDMLDNTEHATNLYHCPLLEPFQLKPFVTPTGSAPILLMIHGDGSSGRGSFGSLWDASNEPYRRRLHARYGDRVLSFEYHSVSRGLLQSALELARVLPAHTTLDLLTIGGGGIVGEILCRVQREDADSPLDDQDFALLREAGLGETAEAARELSSLLEQKRFRIRQFVRVACPARGSTIWGELSAKALSWLKALGVIPATVVDVLNATVERLLLGMLKDERTAPGLTQLGATSAIVRLVNRPELSFAGELAIIAGIHDGSRGLKARLQALAVRWVVKEGADFVVSLDSNFGGAARSGGVYRFIDKGPDVTHFNYFRNASSLDRIVMALVEDSTRAGFESIAFAPKAAPPGRTSPR